MGFAVTAFLVIFVLIASGGLLLFYREAMLQRITEVINPSAKKKGLIGQIQDSGFSVGSLVEHFNSVIPKSQAEVSVVKARLIRAGYRTESSIKIFNGAKFLTPVALCAISWAPASTSSRRSSSMPAPLGSDSWSRILAGKSHQEAAVTTSQRPAGRARFACDLHRSRPQP